MPHATILVVILTALILFPGCTSSPPPPKAEEAEAEPSLRRFEFARVQMGSRARIVLYDTVEPAAAKKAEAAFEEIEHLNLVMSDYDEKSEASRLTQKPAKAWHPVSDDLLDVLQKSARVWSVSGGAFDPTIGPVTQIWRKAMASGELPEAATLREARSHVGFDLVEIDTEEGRVRLLSEGMGLDFGGIGKGYAADRALEIVMDLGARSALVDLGGDLAIGDAPPGEKGWSIEIDAGDAYSTRVLENVGVATSGARYRYIEADGVRYSHIIDPRRGIGLTDPIGVTVIAEKAWQADALASAASVLGRDRVESLRRSFRKAEFLFFAPSP